MPEQPSFKELRDRIGRHADCFGGVLPERYVIAWSGYLAALIEWGLISVSDHERLCKILPPVADAPSVGILLGQPEQH